jgi:hypothetical protein
MTVEGSFTRIVICERNQVDDATIPCWNMMKTKVIRRGFEKKIERSMSVFLLFR